MNPLEHALDYPLGAALPAPGESIEVVPGIRWLRLPLPFQLDHVHVWLLADRIDGRDGWTVIDTGVATAESRALWERVIETQLDGLPIVRVLCTHMHPDHVGLAAMLTERFDCRLWMTPAEFSTCQLVFALAGTDEGAERTVAHYRRHGMVDAAELEALRSRDRTYFHSLVPALPASFHRLRADEPVAIGGRRWQVIIGTGHSPEHASLYSAEGPDGGGPLLLAGDMVLPRISTNVSVFETEPEANPVEWFLRSIAQFERLPADTLALPAHGRPFRRLHERLRQLADHHAGRLEALARACAERPLSAVDALPVVFGREFDLHQRTFAIGEALGHLHALYYRGELERRMEADGVERFAAVVGGRGVT